MLFIDEAYQLNPMRGGGYMTEVVDELVKGLTSEDFKVSLRPYPLPTSLRRLVWVRTRSVRGLRGCIRVCMGCMSRGVGLNQVEQVFHKLRKFSAMSGLQLNLGKSAYVTKGVLADPVLGYIAQ